MLPSRKDEFAGVQVNTTEDGQPVFTVLEEFAHIDCDNFDTSQFLTSLDPYGAIYRKEVYIALMKADGNIGVAAQMLARPRETLVRWLKANHDMAVIAENIRETKLDHVEDVVMRQALQGDGAQARFLLQTRGKERGYTTRVENTGKDGEPLELLKQMQVFVSEDQMERLSEELKHLAHGTGRTVHE